MIVAEGSVRSVRRANVRRANVRRANVRRDLQSRRIEYQDFQSDNRLKNATTPCRWIAIPPERKKSL